MNCAHQFFADFSACEERIFTNDVTLQPLQIAASVKNCFESPKAYLRRWGWKKWCKIQENLSNSKLGHVADSTLFLSDSTYYSTTKSIEP